MPPLSNLEVVGRARMEPTRMGNVLVIPLRVNVNIKSLLLDELLARRKMLHVSMVENLLAETRRDLVQMAHEDRRDGDGDGDGDGEDAGMSSNQKRPRVVAEEPLLCEVEDTLAEFKELLQENVRCDPALYNDDDFYHNAISKALAIKKGTLRKSTELSEQKRTGGPDVWERVRRARAIDFARAGFIYLIRSGTDDIPWDALAEHKLTEVELPVTLTPEQAHITWQCIRQCCSGPQPLKNVSLRGLGGTMVKMDPGVALFGATVSLGGQRLGTSGAKMLIPALKLNSMLTQLDLCGSRMTTGVAREMARVLARCSELKAVNIRGCEIPVLMARTAATLDLACKKAGSEYHTEDAIILAEFISTNTVLTHLDIQKHCIRAEGAEALARALSTNSILVSLNIAHNHIRTAGAIAVSAALQASSCLQSLVLSGNKMGLDGARALIAAIQRQRHLVSLNGIMHEENTQHWDLQDKIKEPLYEAVFVATRIRTNAHLTSLNLAGNSLGRQGADTLRGALIKRTNLTVLNLRGNNLRADGIETLAEALRCMTQLRVLDLSHNQV
jgi:Ran GTPase-activating protein (RanGAP) involved in mRNA processing and transport